MKTKTFKCKCGGEYSEIETYPIIHKGTNKAILYATYKCSRCKLSLSKVKD